MKGATTSNKPFHVIFKKGRKKTKLSQVGKKIKFHRNPHPT